MYDDVYITAGPKFLSVGLIIMSLLFFNCIIVFFLKWC